MMDVQMFHLTALTAAIELLRLQEEKLHARWRLLWFEAKKASPPLLHSPPNVGIPPIKTLTPMEAKERRECGLCFNCDEKFHLSHCCKTNTLFLIDGNWPNAGDDEEVKDESGDQMVENGEENPEISIHAIAGASSPQTMHVRGILKGRQFTYLIDSGSTHNFVDPSISRRLGKHIQLSDKIQLVVANGGRLASQGKCINLEISVQG